MRLLLWGYYTAEAFSQAFFSNWGKKKFRGGHNVPGFRNMGSWGELLTQGESANGRLKDKNGLAPFLPALCFLFWTLVLSGPPRGINK